MNKNSGLIQLVGKTRLVYLKHFSEVTKCQVFGKCEFENPGGSIKDRTALSLIIGAEKRGELVRGESGIIIEGTAGNTGIGLALAAGTLGYECVICVSETVSVEKKQFLKWAGAHLVEVPTVPHNHPNNYVHVAKRLGQKLKETSGIKTFYANQWDNLDNFKAHYNTTGPEILQQVLETTGKPPDAFSCAVGTGGTISGVSSYLRSQVKDIKIGLTDPRGASLVNYYNTGKFASEGSSISEGVGQNRITGNLVDFKPDIALEVHDRQMMECVQLMQQHEGLAIGMSAGLNIAGVVEIAKRLGPNKILVTILCDLGQRYASKIYNEKFLLSKDLPVADWLRTKERDRRPSSQKLLRTIRNITDEIL